MSQDNIKFTEYLNNVKANTNKSTVAKLFTTYQNYIIRKPFMLIVHTIAGITLTSYIIRHEKINHHKTQPHH